MRRVRRHVWGVMPVVVLLSLLAELGHWPFAGRRSHESSLCWEKADPAALSSSNQGVLDMFG